MTTKRSNVTSVSGIAPALRGGATTVVIALALGMPLHAAAQVSVGGSAEASADADIESGANSASEIETGARVDRNDDAHDDDGDRDDDDDVGGGDGDLRLAIQGRLDAINMVTLADPDPFVGQRRLFVPIVTPGVRLLDDSALFLGLGLGFSNFSTDDPGPDETSRSGWSLSPLASYDVLRDNVAALSLLGWIDLASLGETEDCDGGGCMDLNNDAFGWGLSLGAGLRGLINEGLAIGGEFGWGFLDISADAGGDAFAHGIFGNIFLEASIGLD